MTGAHSVEVIGYDEENGKKYWLVKNSWGSSWGDNGYFKIIRGIDNCGFESGAYATLFSEQPPEPVFDGCLS